MDCQFFLSLMTGISIGGAAGYLGAVMLTKRMALVAGPLGHLTLPGVAIAILYGFDVSLGAFPFVIVGIVVIWWLEMRTRLPMEALTAIVFASGVAVTFLFLPVERAQTALLGDISRVTSWEAVLSILSSAILFVVARKIFKPLVLITVAEDLARVEGIGVRRYNLLYLILIAVIVAIGVKVVGGLLTAALVAVPAAAARNITGSLGKYARTSAIIGGVSALFGVPLSRLFSLPAGPLVILTGASIFLIIVLAKKLQDRS
jgi:ABC-type Mn2+/Zn2+ transport system permease subunit